MEETKVFGIGYHKTGTTSLGHALTILGYTVCPGYGSFDPDFAKTVWEKAYRMAEEHDAFQDFPWPLMYKEFDKKYPGSKFILTKRPTDEWINSVVRHFGTTASPVAQWVYGPRGPKGNEDYYISMYERHNKEVQEYFADRPDDLMVFDLVKGEGWERLCAFLNKKVPDAPFPFLCKASDRERSRSFGYMLFSKLRSMISRLLFGRD